MPREVITRDEVRRRARTTRPTGDEVGLPGGGGDAGGGGGTPPAGAGGAAALPAPDDFKSALMKLIPGETIGVYTALSALASAAVASGSQPDPLILGVFLAFGIVFNPIYLSFIAGVSKPVNLVLSTLAFLVYVYAQGDWFESVGLYVPVLGAGLIIMAGALFPILAGIRPKAPAV
jgi:hypothetical protein